MIGSVFGFDHDRRGFVLGAGIGFSPSASWNTNSHYLPDNTGHSGFAVHVLIGGGQSQHDVFVSEWNAVWYSTPTDFVPANAVSVIQWQLAASWYHFYKRPDKSLFTVVGCGPYFLTPAWNKLKEFGGAVLLGAGYEFTRHMQIGVYYSIGREFGLGSSENGCHHLSLLLTVMEY